MVIKFPDKPIGKLAYSLSSKEYLVLNKCIIDLLFSFSEICLLRLFNIKKYHL